MKMYWAYKREGVKNKETKAHKTLSHALARGPWERVKLYTLSRALDVDWRYHIRSHGERRVDILVKLIETKGSGGQSTKGAC